MYSEYISTVTVQCHIIYVFRLLKMNCQSPKESLNQSLLKVCPYAHTRAQSSIIQYDLYHFHTHIRTYVYPRIGTICVTQGVKYSRPSLEYTYIHTYVCTYIHSTVDPHLSTLNGTSLCSSM